MRYFITAVLCAFALSAPLAPSASACDGKSCKHANGKCEGKSCEHKGKKKKKCNCSKEEKSEHKSET